jgi:hypothetical protein
MALLIRNEIFFDLTLMPGLEVKPQKGSRFKGTNRCL